MPGMAIRLTALVVAALAMTPPTAAAHGGDPSVTGLRFPAQRPGEVWAITDNQGLYAAVGDRTVWLCEDAVAPAAGVDDIVALGDGRRWLVLTEVGLFASDDGGCSYGAAPADLADQQIAALSGHPQRPAEAVAVSATFGEENAVWLTTDGGGRWRRSELALRGRFTGLLRGEGDPDRLYALHDRGGFTSADGGRTWTPMALGPPELAALPSAARLLAAPAGGPARLFLGIELPTGMAIAESGDGGRTWREATRVDDFEAELVFDAAGRQGLLITAFDGARRTADGGRTWVAEPLPVERLQHVGRAGDGRLWGSAGLLFGGPFALGVSDDFGRSWAPVLARFEDVEARWDCPADAPARACCETLCPGRPPDAMCPGQAPDEGGACAVEPGPPPGPLPGFEADGGPDAGPLDGGLMDAEVVDAGVGAVDGAAPDRGRPDGASGSGRDHGSADAVRVDSAIGDGSQPDRGSPDGGAVDAGLDAAPDVAAPIYAPDVTVIPAHPPSAGCAQGPGRPSPWWALLALVALRRLSGRRSRRASRLRRASAR